MATVYSLVCWGGRTGKTVTLTDAGDIVNSSAHGLRDGTPLQFTSGTMPSGLALNTTYYSKSTGINAFTLYTTDALTTQVTWIGAGTGPFVLKSYLICNPASTLSPYGLSDLSRWGAPGEERIYDGLASWNAGRAGASTLDKEVCELGEAFNEDMTTSLTLTLPAGAVEVVTKINGINTPAYHAGVLNAGYKITRPAAPGTPSVISTGALVGALLEGFTVACVGGGGYHIYGVSIGFGCTARRIISMGRFNGYGYGVAVVTGATADRCLLLGWAVGAYIPTYQTRPMITNCLAINNGVGVAGAAATNINAVVYNTIAIGNTNNWGVVTSGNIVGVSNAGLSDGLGGFTGGTPWGSTPIGAETTDLIDIAGAGTAPSWTVLPDYRPSIGSVLIDAGVAFYGVSTTDIADAEVPNYNNGGAEAVDVGCYEFDHGYGPHPASTTVTFVGVNVGSEVRVFNTAGIELAGIESSSANPVLSWILPIGDVTIKVVADAYVLIEFTYSSIAGAVALPIQQALDRWYSNP